MEKAVCVFMIFASISLIAGIISRLTLTPIPFVPGTLEAGSLLNFANTCLLFAIALMLKIKSCKS